jgi:polyvinyl alcohol dehydrogenase (cytochrome)
VYRDVVYVPVSSLELVAAADRNYECCTFSGGVVALDVRDGRIIWSSWVLPPAQPYRKSDVGTQLMVPRARRWNSPTIDERRQRLYVGTGTETEVEVPRWVIVMMDLRTGRIVWTNQTTKGT